MITNIFMKLSTRMLNRNICSYFILFMGDRAFDKKRCASQQLLFKHCLRKLGGATGQKLRLGPTLIHRAEIGDNDQSSRYGEKKPSRVQKAPLHYPRSGANKLGGKATNHRHKPLSNDTEFEISTRCVHDLSLV